MILVSTVTTFFMLHTPRLLVSVYEAANFNYQEHCASISRDYFPLWFTCSVAAVNLSLVSWQLYIHAVHIIFSSLIWDLKLVPFVSQPSRGLVEVSNCQEISGRIINLIM